MLEKKVESKDEATEQVSVAADSSEDSPSKTSEAARPGAPPAAIFGGAKPVDTAKREQEIWDKQKPKPEEDKAAERYDRGSFFFVQNDPQSLN